MKITELHMQLDLPVQLAGYCIEDKTALALLGLDSRRSKLSTFLASLLAACLTCNTMINLGKSQADRSAS